MSDSTVLADQARQNGSGEGISGRARRARGAAAGIGQRAVEATVGNSKTAQKLLGRAFNSVASRLSSDLDDRDADYIRERLPLLWLLSSVWFRAEVRGLGEVPEEGPVLLVGNHSGGTMTPDTIIFTLAFSTYFGVERPFYQLAHNLVLASPVGPLLKRFGTVSASHEHAREALESGAAVLVYPGGDWEVHRPSWKGNEVDFAGRKGFIRLALNAGVPIVPVVAAGGQETALFLSQGGGISRALRLDKLFRLKVLPISLAAPWGLNIGDFLGHLPLPAKITMQVLPAIDLREEFGKDPDIDEVYDHITATMQSALDSLAAERRFPVIG
jgi:1-acyl-sn-glycerol-3-phosphate acyltransferase